mgnify:CR=1 FL=1
MVETIGTITLSAMKNALYSQFMADVDFQVQRVTPEALKIKKCYTAFTAGLERLDNSFVVQRKDNRTADLAAKDTTRDNDYRCTSGHISADIFNPNPDKQSAAQILRNKLDAYGYLPGMGNNEESAKMDDLCKDLQAPPLAELIEKLGLTAEVKAMKDANDAFIALSRERTESGKTLSTEETKAARAELDGAYRDMITVVNSQISLNALMDEEEEERPGELSVDPVDPLTDFAQSINALIKEYKTKMAQSGSSSSGSERPGEL